jgi:catechol 2,3-dioxygenase-like lactoylglutathione lyase family enzyme
MLSGARFGTRDIKRAIAFYDAVTAEIGATRMIDRHGMAGYRGMEGGIFLVGTPREGEACVGNGSQVMWSAPSRAAVDSAHAKALELGGTCEGAPGPRGAVETKMYAAYFRDPDGNKVMVMRVGD